MSTTATRRSESQTTTSNASESRLHVPSQSSSNTQLQNSPKKKQSFALRSLKDSLKFKGSSNHKKNVDSRTAAETPRMSKVRNGLPMGHASVRSKQRLSAQRVSLFKYEKVRAMSCSVESGTRRGSESSSSTMTLKSGETTSDASLQSRSSVKLKPTALIASGALEVYQISTPNLNPNQKTQEMNYLSLGRKDTVVHPILPRLQVSKLEHCGQKFLISFYNPERYWEIEFLSCKDPKATSDAIKEFESVISKICIFTTQEQKFDSLDRECRNTKNQGEISNDSLASQNSLLRGDIQEKKINEDEDDDLSYLLVEDNTGSLRSRKEAAIHSTGKADSDDSINEAFKRAIQNFKPSSSQRSHDWYHGSAPSSRRFSSYQAVSNFSNERTDIISKRFSSFSIEINNG
ncbi:hypothetical protein HG535_0A07020 [Zygotorulaspora mrakii]|uniref:Inheritance of peroxisomes protein 1 n=1 Tax=Zygotorulaspora mrakii TaxID=42260 RepID=A0A7H9AWH4_ZYGMR|nr:uncharacterized protein HG535_0A07020 [Zygotorulaspora mrakii]QLG70760.1 hypothetical protein HG535_0A07020 [Zygotorulaspora mrakii]